MTAQQYVDAHAVAVPRACPQCGTMKLESTAMTRCSQCDLIYRPMTPSQDEIEYWTGYVDNTIERGYDRLREPFFRSYWKLLRRLVPNQANRTPALLDVGCVPGQLLREAEADGWETGGVELSEPLCTLTRSYCDARLWCGPVEHLDFQGATFDLIVASNVVRHLSHPRDALQRMVGLLRPGGSIVIREMNGGLSRYAARREAPYAFDMQFLTPRTSMDLLRSVGLSRTRVLNSPQSMATIRWMRALAEHEPDAYAAFVGFVNDGLSLANPLAALSRTTLTPMFLAVGSLGHGHRCG